MTMMMMVMMMMMLVMTEFDKCFFVIATTGIYSGHWLDG